MLDSFLATLRDNIKEFESGNGDENIQGKKKQAKEVAANEIFLNKELKSEEESDNEFDKESVEKFDEEFDNKSDDNSDEKSDKKFVDKPNDKSEQNNKARVDLITTYSTIHARKKLVKILNGKVIVPKQ